MVTDAPRPWHVRWTDERAHQLVAADGRIVAFGFPTLFSALMWARGR